MRVNRMLRNVLSRRALLKGMAAIGFATAGAPLVSCGPAPGEGDGSNDTETSPDVVYRFQTPRTTVCSACKTHARYKVFTDEASAREHRAHKGCNCRIVTQRITPEYWDTIASYERNGVIDLREIYG